MGKLGKALDILSHPQEIMPLIRIYRAAQRAMKLPSDPDLAFCYGMLNDVSRSFAVVIQQLPVPLRDAVCIFYLVLRGLDTVEDDMALPDDVKLPALLSFHERINDRDFVMDCGYNHYKRLMNNFGIVINVFLGLAPHFQEAIADITRRMGAGMAKFITQEVETVAQYDEYCHYVAGLVGIGLSNLFASSALEDPVIAKSETLSNHMGLFLQKTNIIRDYLEDILEEPAPRMFWPREIWGQYAAQLSEFKHPENRGAALQCLNHMVVDALQHLPHCVQYMRGLRDTHVFRFCAIPQVMALGTLALCYNNGAVFEGVVKMRRGQTACVFDGCDHLGHLFKWYLTFLNLLGHKLPSVSKDDPTLQQARETVQSHKTLCKKELVEWRRQGGAPQPSLSHWLWDYSALTAAGVYAYVAWGLGDPIPGLPASLLSGYQQLHQALAVVLLLLALRAAVLLR